MKNSWNVERYSQFLDLRTRPAKDLLSAIPDSFKPHKVYDLGCGPGNSTILLKKRWPDAEIIGLDSSDEMLANAKANYPDILFVNGDIADFTVSEKIDCIFANASLQWLDHHEILIPNLLQQLKVGGMFGFQMPNNFHSPSHQVTIHILQSNTKWQSLLIKLRYGVLREPLYNLSWYYDLLTKCSVKSLQIWETTYFQEMSDYPEIFDWVKATGLRPVLSEMDAKNQDQFKKIYIQSIATKYPKQINNKILLPFRRIFMVGNK